MAVLPLLEEALAVEPQLLPRLALMPQQNIVCKLEISNSAEDISGYLISLKNKTVKESDTALYPAIASRGLEKYPY